MLAWTVSPLVLSRDMFAGCVGSSWAPSSIVLRIEEALGMLHTFVFEWKLALGIRIFAILSCFASSYCLDDSSWWRRLKIGILRTIFIAVTPLIGHMMICWICFHRAPESIIQIFGASVKNLVIKDKWVSTWLQTLIGLTDDVATVACSWFAMSKSHRKKNQQQFHING